MTETGGFIARWSRLKQSARSPVRQDEPLVAEPAPGGEAAPVTAPATVPAAPTVTGAAGPEPEALDLASLPPIESIVAATDIRPFLQAGVPAELTQGALRTAWSADPAIRDFIEIAENQWDFNDPAGIPGFGPLAGTELAEGVPGMVGRGLAEASTALGAMAVLAASPVAARFEPPREDHVDQVWRSAAEARPPVSAIGDGLPGTPGTGAVVNAAQGGSGKPRSGRRSHGGALPQ